MDTGLGGNSLLWTNALPAVAAVTEAITFDRAGSGWSDPAPAGQRRTSRQLVAELRRLLLAAGAEPPSAWDSAGRLRMGHRLSARD